MEHFAQYLKEHPDQKAVKGSQHETLLRWAHKKRYITLSRFGKRLLYTPFDLEVALMWQEKTGGKK